MRTWTGLAQPGSVILRSSLRLVMVLRAWDTTYATNHLLCLDTAVHAGDVSRSLQCELLTGPWPCHGGSCRRPEGNA